ncbi:hypothetical protein CANARDRAFT_8626 [[Candida] arabinofermentans NRRL YB-2248]|uniref:Uncharacterized protein n=1 Tax=[Candida] arabinofermentans NRRL YB-2248 TaxID=983967 RepID=A0A1E4SYS8_9ASCO|nr:hypothetical protein CANARDRAFT_8626 [[Candida] arabinofermentans NRRL YB-2248]
MSGAPKDSNYDELLDPNNPDFLELKKNAVKFYSLESKLNTDDRKLLFDYYTKKVRLYTNLTSLSFVVGLTIPTIVLVKKKKIINPFIPLGTGLATLSIGSSIVVPAFLSRAEQEFDSLNGSESRVWKLKNSLPDTLLYDMYLSGYFKETLKNENVRMNDPQQCHNFMELVKCSIVFKDLKDPGDVEFVTFASDEDQNSDGIASSNRQVYRSAWDRVRHTDHPLQNEFGDLDKDKNKEDYDDPFSENSGDDDQTKENGSAWEKIRRNRPPKI